MPLPKYIYRQHLHFSCVICSTPIVEKQLAFSRSIRVMGNGQWVMGIINHQLAFSQLATTAQLYQQLT